MLLHRWVAGSQAGEMPSAGTCRTLSTSTPHTYLTPATTLGWSQHPLPAVPSLSPREPISRGLNWGIQKGRKRKPGNPLPGHPSGLGSLPQAPCSVSTAAGGIMPAAPQMSVFILGKGDSHSGKPFEGLFGYANERPRAGSAGEVEKMWK